MKYLAEAKNEITKTTQEFSGTDSTDMTGVISNLRQIKKLVASGNLSMQQIVSFNQNLLGGYSQIQLAQLANTWTGNNLTLEKSTDIQNRITIVNDGLESLLNYANSININNVSLAFAGIINSEKLKNQKVEIVNTRKANITQNLNYIETNVNTLKTTFTQARGLYNSIGQLNDNISAIQNKKSAINGVTTCGSPNPSPCGCDSSHYKVVCDALDMIVGTLQTNLTNINDAIVKIHLYETNESGTMVTTQPFDEINEALSPTNVA